MIELQFHILSEDFCFPHPHPMAQHFITLYRMFDLVLAQKEDCHLMSNQHYCLL